MMPPPRFSFAEPFHDEASGEWRVRADRTLGGVWLVSFVLVVALFWTLTGSTLSWALSAVFMGTILLSARAQMRSVRTWSPTIEDDGIRVRGELVPFSAIRSLRRERLIVLSMLSQPVVEATALVIDGSDGATAHAFMGEPAHIDAFIALVEERSA